MKMIIFFFCLFSLLTSEIFSQDIKAIQLIERQKRTFQDQSWPNFFANALYLRAWLYQDDLRWSTPGLDQAISLEILALTQHCQFELANTIAQEILSHEQAAQLNKKFIEEAQEQVKLQKAFQHLSVEPSIKSQEQKNKNPTLNWPIPYSNILKVSNIDQLEVRLKNLCQESGV